MAVEDPQVLRARLRIGRTQRDRRRDALGERPGVQTSPSDRGARASAQAVDDKGERERRAKDKPRDPETRRRRRRHESYNFV